MHVIAAASGLGAPDPGCGEGPERLIAAGLLERLSARGDSVASSEVLRPRAEAGKSQEARIVEFCERLEMVVAHAMQGGAFPLVLGGDHSCAIGTWRGVAREVRAGIGLVWIDAHMDSHTGDTTPSGMIHGMPLAVLLGHGGDTWAGRAAIDPAHTCVVGVRSHEPEEAALLESLGVRIFAMEEIRDRGLPAVIADAVAIAARGTAGYGVTLDVDAIDPEDAPGAGSPVPGGIRATELIEALAPLSRDQRLIALEVAEYNPHLDRESCTLQVIGRTLDALLAKRP